MQRLMAAACSMAFCVGARGFTLPAGNVARLPRVHADAVGLSPETASTKSSRSRDVSGRAAADASRSAAWPCLSACLLLAGAAGLRRRRARAAPTIRRVTMEQIETLTLDDMPAFWKPKVTIARARRMALVSRIREELDRSFFVMSWNYEGLSNQEFAEARAMFPTQIKVRCLKKTQFAKAAEGTGFEEWAKQLVGHNCFIFVAEDTDLKETITAYLKMSKKFNRDQAMAESWEKMKGKMKSGVLKTSMGGVMRDEWNIITAEELPKYKDFPTKLELIAKVAGAIKQVPQKLAVCTNQLPQKTAIGIKKIVEKMEEEGKATVGDVAV